MKPFHNPLVGKQTRGQKWAENWSKHKAKRSLYVLWERIRDVKIWGWKMLENKVFYTCKTGCLWLTKMQRTSQSLHHEGSNERGTRQGKNAINEALLVASDWATERLIWAQPALARDAVERQIWRWKKGLSDVGHLLKRKIPTRRFWVCLKRHCSPRTSDTIWCSSGSIGERPEGERRQHTL